MNNDHAPQRLVGEFAKLATRLKVSKDRFRPDADDHGRSAARDALAAAIEFISEILPEGAELALPLHQVLYGLKDLDAGQVVPLLQRAEISNRPPDPLVARLFEAKAAALMELHRVAGLSRKEAGRAAARDLNRCGYRDAQRQPITGTQVMHWRDRVKAARLSTDLPAQRYRLCLDGLNALFPNKPREAVAFFLDALPRMIPPAIPQNPTS